MNGKICGALVQFGCYQHRMNVKASIYVRLSLNNRVLVFRSITFQVAVGALQFFLTSNDSADTTEDTSSEDESDGEVSKALRTMVISKQLTKKGKKRERKLAKAMAKIKVVQIQ